MIHTTPRLATLGTFQSIFVFIQQHEMGILELLARLHKCPPDSTVRLLHAIDPLVEVRLSDGHMRVRPIYAHLDTSDLCHMAWHNLLEQDTMLQISDGTGPAQ